MLNGGIFVWDLSDNSQPTCTPATYNYSTELADDLYWLDHCLLYTVQTHSTVAVLLNIDAFERANPGEAVENATTHVEVHLDQDGQDIVGHEGIRKAEYLSTGKGFFVIATNTTDPPMLDVWCAPSESGPFRMTRLGDDTAQITRSDKTVQVSAYGSRFAVLDVTGAIELYDVNLQSRSVARLSCLPPCSPRLEGLKRQSSLALDEGEDGRSVALCVLLKPRFDEDGDGDVTKLSTNELVLRDFEQPDDGQVHNMRTVFSPLETFGADNTYFIRSAKMNKGQVACCVQKYTKSSPLQEWGVLCMATPKGPPIP